MRAVYSLKQPISSTVNMVDTADESPGCDRLAHWFANPRHQNVIGLSVAGAGQADDCAPYRVSYSAVRTFIISVHAKLALKGEI